MIISLVGATASGKTEASLWLAQLLGGAEKVEIISADAMQLYRGMDIGTAKLPPEERQGIVHHQIDVLDISQEASVVAYQRQTRQTIENIWERGKTPLIVGGSGLYMSAVLDELDFPGTDPALREELTRQAETDKGSLLEELRDKDPEAYRVIHPNNMRRIIRALEVIRLTGKPFTPRFPRHTSHYPFTIALGIKREPENLQELIVQRAQHMMDSGLLDETRALIERGLRTAPTASTATGYAQAISVIDGEMTEQEAVQSIALATTQLAKKQKTWFKADPRITWFDATYEPLEHIATNMYSHIRERMHAMDKTERMHKINRTE